MAGIGQWKNEAAQDAYMKAYASLSKLWTIRYTEFAKAGLGYRTRTPWPQRLKDEELQAITVPALLIYGSETVLGNPERAAARARRHLPDCEVEIYPGANHGLLFHSPGKDAVLDRILAFARSHEPADLLTAE
ncbi:alpha/beta hydrolase [Nocardia sp. NPDC004860]|uniref:alpha/beta hydrolase n=1 Tax=Nocardia sp. NPDC004860 TaxID=3154557 RepID=UPI0033AFEE06